MKTKCIPPLNYITDHKAIFILVDSIKYSNPPPTFIKTEVDDDKRIQKHVDELKQKHNDPNQNYNTFEKLLLYAKTKDLTTKIIKYSK